MNKTILTHAQVFNLAKNLQESILFLYPTRDRIAVYPIPRGGVPVAYLLNDKKICLVNSPELADVFVDDIIDSGKTKATYNNEYPGVPFLALVNKEVCNNQDWYVFPWETENEHSSAEDVVIRMLQYIGEDPSRGGLLETPGRVVKAWSHWFSGYNQNPADVLKVFEDGAKHYDEMIVRKNIPCMSFCEHHMAPIIGQCTIAYIPNGRIVGLSKLDRLVDVFARRLQVQERLTVQIADALVEHLQPLGVGVWLEARHMCIESRGVEHCDSNTITLALRGCMKTEDAARAEFLSLAKS
jgi:GTP cyclohydrolase I